MKQKKGDPWESGHLLTIRLQVTTTEVDDMVKI